MMTSIEQIGDTITDSVIDNEIDKVASFAEKDAHLSDKHNERKEALEHLHLYGQALKARRDQLGPFFRALS